MVQSLALPPAVSEIIRHHHERYDGSGYPDGLKGDAIPFLARLVGLANAFDELYGERPENAPLPLEAAKDYLRRQAGILFDPSMVKVILRRLEWQWSILGSLPVEFIKRVGQSDQTGEEGDGVAFQAIRVAGPVIPFVVVADDLTDCRRQGERLDHASADFRMKFDELVFAVPLPDDGRKQAFVNAELSDVVQQGADPDHFPLLLGQREPVRQQGGVTVHTVRMADQFRILGR